jgi:hypothetical protein
MSDARERLAHKLMMEFRLPPGRPTAAELEGVLAEIRALGGVPAGRVLGEIVHRRVRSTGKYIYDGLDFQNLNTLFAIVLQQSRDVKK